MSENFFVYQLYQQLRSVSLSDALTAFDDLREDSLTPEIADKYFGSFGVGDIPQGIHAPYERFICYTFLLSLLSRRSKSKFQKMHKGTPYYFLAGTSFKFGDYEKALFYMDATIAEDMRIPSWDWRNTPIGKMLTLTAGGTAWSVESKLKKSFQELLDNFNTELSLRVNGEQFVLRFVLPLIEQNKRDRSIVTSLYSFILEFYDRKEMLSLRSSEGGSIEPFLMHLLKGTVIFETLIKKIADQQSWRMDSGKNTGKQIKTLGNLNYCSSFTSNYCPLQNQAPIATIGDILTQIFTNKTEEAINTVYFLRNKIAHDLRWDDIFTVNNYEKLFRQIINAILIVIYKEFP